MMHTLIFNPFTDRDVSCQLCVCSEYQELEYIRQRDNTFDMPLFIHYHKTMHLSDGHDYKIVNYANIGRIKLRERERERERFRFTNLSCR